MSHGKQIFVINETEYIRQLISHNLVQTLVISERKFLALYSKSYSQ